MPSAALPKIEAGKANRIMAMRAPDYRRRQGPLFERAGRGGTRWTKGIPLARRRSRGERALILKVSACVVKSEQLMERPAKKRWAQLGKPGQPETKPDHSTGYSDRGRGRGLVEAEANMPRAIPHLEETNENAEGPPLCSYQAYKGRRAAQEGCETCWRAAWPV